MKDGCIPYAPHRALKPWEHEAPFSTAEEEQFALHTDPSLNQGMMQIEPEQCTVQVDIFPHRIHLFSGAPAIDKMGTEGHDSAVLYETVQVAFREVLGLARKFMMLRPHCLQRGGKWDAVWFYGKRLTCSGVFVSLRIIREFSVMSTTPRESVDLKPKVIMRSYLKHGYLMCEESPPSVTVRLVGSHQAVRFPPEPLVYPPSDV
jgi:hypothetical protein